MKKLVLNLVEIILILNCATTSKVTILLKKITTHLKESQIENLRRLNGLTLNLVLEHN